MNLSTHPGLRILDTFQAHGMESVAEAAEKLGIRREELYRVINGMRGISPELAARLETAFGDSAEAWLRLQTNYDHAMMCGLRANSFLLHGL